MGIRLDTTESELARQMAEETARMERAIVRTLQYVGESSVRHARSLVSPSAASFPTFPKIPPHQPNYIDWSANLRSSIGYVVVADGRIIGEGGFDAESPTATEGVAAGKETARKAAAEFPTGFTLIVTAGMHYASYVADKGYDVTASAELLSERLAEQLFSQL